MQQSHFEQMTTAEYLAALKKLGMTRASKVTAEALGLSVRQCQRIAAGTAPVPMPVERLLKMYLWSEC